MGGGCTEEGAVRENIFIYFIFKTEEWTICMMFNAGGSEQGAEWISFTSHLTHLHIKNKTSQGGVFFQRVRVCRKLCLFVLNPR